MARMTRQYLAVPATSASPERLFSSVGLVMSACVVDGMTQVTPSHKIHAAFTLNHAFNAFHLELSSPSDYQDGTLTFLLSLAVLSAPEVGAV